MIPSRQFIFLLIISIGWAINSLGFAQTPSPAVQNEKPASYRVVPDYQDPIAANKTFFDAVATENYQVAWDSLTKKSQKRFIEMVAESDGISKKMAKDLFVNNKSPIRLGFWKAFRRTSKLAEFAPYASYKLLEKKGKVAVVQAYISSETAIDSKLFKTGKEWKMGYVESFMEEK